MKEQIWAIYDGSLDILQEENLNKLEILIRMCVLWLIIIKTIIIMNRV